ncbi:MAG: amidohydrolase family protein, partial [Thaumarchaeota archaeon]|nr:amidohydrolase family protein [Nitrososphaerota archaeon]
MNNVVVDFHNHLRPKAFVDALIDSGISKVKMDENGNRYLIDNNVLMTKLPEDLVFGESELTKRIDEMGKASITMQVLSVPRSHDFEASVAPKLCRIINDAFAKIVKAHPQMFAGLASLPLNDIQASIEELDRAMTQLELHGVCIGGNVSGVALDDQRFFPLYEKMNAMEAMVFIHPGVPPWGKLGLEKYYLWAALGYQFDTVVAASSLMYGGVFDQFP